MDETLDNSKIESPLEIYKKLLQQNRDRLVFQQKWDRYLEYAKVALGLLAVFLMVRFVHELHGIWPLLPAAAVFVVLAIVHEGVLARI
jgi:membrane protein YdbS with pleckstrin-like domain